MPDHLIRTDEVLTRAELIDMLDWDESEDEDGPLGDLRETHDGEWRREGESYRWYRFDGAYGVFNFGREHMPAGVEVEPGVFAEARIAPCVDDVHIPCRIELPGGFYYARDPDYPWNNVLRAPNGIHHRAWTMKESNAFARACILHFAIAKRSALDQEEPKTDEAKTQPRFWHGQRSLSDWAAEQAERLRAYFKHARYPAEKTLIGPIGMEEWKAGYATASDHLAVLDYLAARGTVSQGSHDPQDDDWLDEPIICDE